MGLRQRAIGRTIQEFFWITEFNQKDRIWLRWLNSLYLMCNYNLNTLLQEFLHKFYCGLWMMGSLRLTYKINLKKTRNKTKLTILNDHKRQFIRIFNDIWIFENSYSLIIILHKTWKGYFNIKEIVIKDRTNDYKVQILENKGEYHSVKRILFKMLIRTLWTKMKDNLNFF